MENEDRIPGIVLSLHSSEVRKVGGKVLGDVSLIATVADLDLWEAIIQKLDGMKIYEAEDFHDQILSLQQEDNEALTSALDGLKAELRAFQEDASSRSQREKELEEMNTRLGEELKRLQALEQELQELANTC